MGFSFIVPIAFFGLVALVVLAVIGTKIDATEGGHEVIKNVYVYLVLFATLMMTIGGSVATFMAIADIIAPAPYHQTFEEFKRWGMEKGAPEQGTTEKLSEAEMKEQYAAMVQNQKENQIWRARNALVKSFGWIVIPLPIFIYFQRRLATNAS